MLQYGIQWLNLQLQIIHVTERLACPRCYVWNCQAKERIALPWKDDPPLLENNNIMAVHRPKLLKKRLLKEPKLLTKYRECIENLLLKEYTKKAPAPLLDGKAYYLLHHAMFHPAKPGKVHVVFDCFARYRGSSLSDKLLQGPDFTNSLVVSPGLHETRWLQWVMLPLVAWWDLRLEPEELMMTVHLFGVSSPSCANFALRKNHRWQQKGLWVRNSSYSKVKLLHGWLLEVSQIRANRHYPPERSDDSI